mmetsp:Transcript_29381/g.51571  ORF Transcript_29381/g.51571 Transcript_29381/m.51571 type:complete len:527 (+) Transcript_29381:211-1791(+)|eukprot:CAMPEP_0197530602 /NCGR_PEP_ID=MMETSP1318-20131121/32376_1 /TAXON_ID=552666 /ORGANISM="Partenskyella glossopodia, Strain RCC365" /LENGTH=526 /DNA_ID=CAMNT_0043086501 /DNA_START=210 /DNA_END=1790 /DNA_ORIENTATION=-
MSADTPALGSDADLAQLAQSFKDLGGAQKTPPKNSKEDLAALAARLRGDTPAAAAQPTPTQTTPTQGGETKAPSSHHVAKNSDADLRLLAESIGAAPKQGSNTGDLHDIAQQLLNPNQNKADGTVDRQQQPPIAPIPEGGEEEGEEDTQQTQQAQQVDSKNGDKQDQHSYEDIVEDMGEIHMEHDWVQFVDEESGYPYWYNTKTQETTWEEPIEDFHIDESAAHLIQKDSANSANTPREGFICPKCMLEFNTQELLVQHCKTCTATRTDQAAAAANGPQTRAPVMNIATKPPKPQSIADRLFGYFGGKRDDDDEKDFLTEAAGNGQGGQVVNLTEKQLRKLIGLNKRNKQLKNKLQKQTEKYNQNIKLLVDRDRKYKILLRRQEEQHLKDLHVLKEQNARLAKGISQQHEEFKRKNFKVLKQNQSMGKQLSAALISLQEKTQLESDNKTMRQENLKLRQYIQRLQRELVEQKNIVGSLKDATKAAHKKIVELEGKVQLSRNSVELDDDNMPVANLPAKEEPHMASV